MPRLEALVRGEAFDPRRSRDRFRVALTDHASAVLLPALLECIRAEAPGITLDVSVWQSRMYDDVAAGRLELALSAEAVPASLKTEVIYHETFVCMVGSGVQTRVRRFTLKQYLDLPHAVVETWERQQTPVDRRLAELGVKRRAALCLPFFVPTVLAIARTDLVLTLPRRLARIMAPIAGVRVVEPPREIKGFSYFMAAAPPTRVRIGPRVVSRASAKNRREDLIVSKQTVRDSRRLSARARCERPQTESDSSCSLTVHSPVG